MSTQKVAVVTGANKGIGYAIVKGLCEKYKGVVYLTARDESRGQAAVAKLKALGFSPSFHQLDITDQSSINRFRDYIDTTHGGIDVLINNAGFAFPADSKASLEEQAEKTLEINYFSTLRLCEALFPLLRADARVVNISSTMGHPRWIPSADVRAKFRDPALTVPKLNELMEKFLQDVKDNKVETEGWGNNTYVISKVGLSALTVIQQKTFDKEEPNRNISVNSVHPGYVDTDLSDHKGPLTIEEGAKAPLFLALDADLKGKYIWYDCQVVDWFGDTTPTLY